MTDTPETKIARRHLLSRIGLVAAAAYTIPAFTTLSMAQASSNASTPSAASVSEASVSEPSVSEASVSEPSVSEPSVSEPSASVASIPSVCRIGSSKFNLQTCEIEYPEIFAELAG